MYDGVERSGPEPGSFGGPYEAQERADGVEDEPCFGMLDNLIVVSEGLVVADIAEFVEHADRALDDTARYLANRPLLLQRLDVLADPAMQRVVLIERDAALIQKMRKFLHAISVEPVQRCGRTIDSDVTLDCGDQFLERLIALEKVDRIRLRRSVIGFDLSDQFVEPRLDRLVLFRIHFIALHCAAMHPQGAQDARDHVRIFYADEGAEVLRLGSTVEGVALLIDFDTELVFEEFAHSAIGKIQHVSAVYVERII